jgi:3-oxoacyl-[acyl-carrier-protein] synthase-1
VLLESAGGTGTPKVLRRHMGAPWADGHNCRAAVDLEPDVVMLVAPEAIQGAAPSHRQDPAAGAGGEVRVVSCRLEALGILCPIGNGPQAVYERLVAGDTAGIVPRGDLVFGEERFFGVVTADLPPLPAALAEYECWNNRIALAALDQIRPAVDAAIAEHGAARVGVVVGSSTSGFTEGERAFRVRQQTGSLDPRFTLAQLEFGGLPEVLAAAAGARGPAYAISTACSSGAKALVAARSLLALELCDAVITGSVDTLCQFTANGFHALSALSAGHTNPMSRNRDGLNLGEGGALFLVTRRAGGVQLLGAGASSDAHHMSAPHPEGHGARAAMAAALADAGLAATDIAYLNLHGTGTPLNDATESLAVAQVLGTGVPCSSTKALTGHTLGAAGSIEAAFLWLMLQYAADDTLRLPPHRFDGERDPDLPSIRLAAHGDTAPRGALMSNSFGFGGNNCSLILGGAP